MSSAVYIGEQALLQNTVLQRRDGLFDECPGCGYRVGRQAKTVNGTRTFDLAGRSADQPEVYVQRVRIDLDHERARGKIIKPDAGIQVPVARIGKHAAANDTRAEQYHACDHRSLQPGTLLKQRVQCCPGILPGGNPEHVVIENMGNA